ncbi:hypothetical protein [Marinobacter sp.]|uniref:hypothetical protein n=1 Tax=Marinobacter sp. TaxID=50741 RepID=UPI002352F3FF|nr:hypothetical protein [Marinobacter sp.]
MASIFDVDPKTGLTGVQTLLGNVTMPSLVNPQITNKQMIDAAILRGSLELLKPRQAGENFASQASRALKAGTDFGKDVFDQQQSALETLLKQKKLAQGSIRPQVTITSAKIMGFRDVGKALFENNQEFKDIVTNLTGSDIFNANNPKIRSITTNAISYQSEFGGTIDNAILESARAFEKAQKVSKDPDADITG